MDRSGLIDSSRRVLQRHSLLALAFAVFYLLLQSFSVAHAVEFGDADHTHNGQECILASIAQRDGDAFAPDCPDLPAPEKAEKPAILFYQGALVAGHEAPPSARAPPFFQ